MKKRKEKDGKEVIHLKMSEGNVTDLIVPFLYQTKVLKPSDEVERLLLDLCYIGNKKEPYVYAVFVYLK